jgi:hypothetical protein
MLGWWCEPQGDDTPKRPLHDILSDYIRTIFAEIELWHL